MLSLRFLICGLTSLLLATACTGKRSDPPNSDPARINGAGGTSNGGASSSGGSSSSGGTNSAGGGGAGMGGGGAGAGGMPAGVGGGGAGAGPAGVGGGTTANDVSDMYGLCGCLDDAQEPGSCSSCFNLPLTTSTCLGQSFANCAAGCTAIINFLQTNPLCQQVDEACLQAAYNIAPEEWDDAVDLVSCKCAACPAPFGCDAVSCIP